MSVSNNPIKKVVVHPLVLLSVVDHFNRVTKGANFRVVGVLLGSIKKGVVDVRNSFAVPFEEDRKDEDIWFFDQNYVSDMYGMCRKVTSKEMIVGWYSTGPKIKKSDIHIHQLLTKYYPYPSYVIIDAKAKEKQIPTKAYISVEERVDQNKQPILTFDHIESEIGALEAEEIGVEHLLRGVKDSTVSDLANVVKRRMQSLEEMRKRLDEIIKYLNLVVDDKLPINNQILYILQDIFNKLPRLKEVDIRKGFVTKTNDKMIVMYVNAILRTILGLHNLIDNKLDMRDYEKEEKEEKEKDLRYKRKKLAEKKRRLLEEKKTKEKEKKPKKGEKKE